MTGIFWAVEDPAGRPVLHLRLWLGWAQVLLRSFMIDDFGLFRLRQVYLRVHREEYTPVPSRARLCNCIRYVRASSTSARLADRLRGHTGHDFRGISRFASPPRVASLLAFFLGVI